MPRLRPRLFSLAGLVAHVRPEEIALVLFAIVLLAIMVATRTFQLGSYRHPRFLQCVLVLALLVAAREFRRAKKALPRIATRSVTRAALLRAAGATLTVARDFAPFFGIALLYETLHDLTPLLRPHIVDGTLLAIDRAVFGVDVSYWLGLHATPLLTRVMVWCYASYFVSPALLASVIYFTGDRALFRDLLLAGVLCAVLGYTGYLLVPAVGPYVYEADLFPTRLPGGGAETHVFIRAIDDLKGVARDCFPSLHTAHTTVVLAFSWRFRRAVFWCFLPIALGLYVSTVYLRMHYVVDVAAGFVTAAIAVGLAPRINRKWRVWRGEAILTDGATEPVTG